MRRLLLLLLLLFSAVQGPLDPLNSAHTSLLLPLWLLLLMMMILPSPPATL